MSDMEQLLAYFKERDEKQREEARQQREELLELFKDLKGAHQIKPETSFNVTCAGSPEEGKAAIILQSPEDFIDRQIGEFVYAPKEGLTFEPWLERTRTVFASERGSSLPESSKTQIIRSKLSQPDYQVFSHTILPKKAEELSLDETAMVLTRLFGRKESIFARRHKVMQIQMMPGEDFRTYAARVNRAGEEFELDTFTTDDLKAQLFTQGLQHPEVAAIRKKVMEKIEDVLARRKAEDPPNTPKLTLDDLATIADRMLIREEESRLIENQPTTKQEVFAVGSGSCKWDCKYCGDKHWHTDCPFRTKLCSSCNIIGHKKGYCVSAKAFKDRYKQRTTQKEVISAIWSKQPQKPRYKTVSPRINGELVTLKHDSGSTWVIISRSNWQRIGSPRLSQPQASAISASGNPVNILGYFSAVVELKDKSGTVDCYVASHELNLFGNSALEGLELWEQPASAYCDSITTTQPPPTEEGSTVNKEQPTVNAVTATSFKLEGLQQATENCEHLKLVRRYIETGWPSKSRYIPDHQAATYFQLRSELHIVNNCIFFGNRAVIPPKLREGVLEELHKGHPGAKGMQLLARERCFWTNINHQITAFVIRCHTCTINSRVNQKDSANIVNTGAVNLANNITAEGSPDAPQRRHRSTAGTSSHRCTQVERIPIG